MIYPTLNSLMTKVDSKYTLVVAVAKRARQLVAGEKPVIDIEGAAERPITTAIREVDEGLVTYKHTKEGYK